MLMLGPPARIGRLFMPDMPAAAIAAAVAGDMAAELGPPLGGPPPGPLEPPLTDEGDMFMMFMRGWFIPAACIIPMRPIELMLMWFMFMWKPDDPGGPGGLIGPMPG